MDARQGLPVARSRASKISGPEHHTAESRAEQSIPGSRAESAQPGRDGVTSSRVIARRIDRPRPALESQIPADAHARFGAALERLLGVDRFERYAGPRLTPEFSGSGLKVTASSRALADLLRRRFMTELHTAAEEALGRGVQITVVSDDREPGTVETPASAGRGASAASGGPRTGPGPAIRDESGVVREPKPAVTRAEAAHVDTLARPPRAANLTRYRLEDFIVGESNRLAYTSAIRISESEALAGPLGYSLLFLHGPCGVGKTHLLQGVALRYRERHPGAMVRVTSGDAFLTEFVNAVRDASGASSGSGSGIERFRRNYRRVDLLCIDDVQALANKGATQAELLHTFEEIARSGARVVLASDQAPRQLAKFSPALISRFQAGMVAGMTPPDEDLIKRLIKALALKRGLNVDDTGIAAIAAHARLAPGAASGVSVRELEGLITRLEAVVSLVGEEGSPARSGLINLLAVERALGSPGAGSSPSGSPRAFARPVRIDTIITQTCRFLSVDPADLSARTRHKRVVLARALITHLARQFTTMSYPEIARAIGRPNHSTVITAYQRLAGQIAADEMLGHEHVPEPMTVGKLIERLGTAITNAS